MLDTSDIVCCGCADDKTMFENVSIFILVADVAGTKELGSLACDAAKLWEEVCMIGIKAVEALKAIDDIVEFVVDDDADVGTILGIDTG